MQNICLDVQSDNVAVFRSFPAVLLLVCLKYSWLVDWLIFGVNNAVIIAKPATIVLWTRVLRSILCTVQCDLNQFTPPRITLVLYIKTSQRTLTTFDTQNVKQSTHFTKMHQWRIKIQIVIVVDNIVLVIRSCIISIIGQVVYQMLLAIHRVKCEWAVS